MAPLHHYKLLSFIGLCLLLALRTNAISLTTLEIDPSATIEPTKEPSATEESSEMSFITETMSVTPTHTPSPPPRHDYSQIRAIRSNCMYIEIGNLSVNFTSASFIERNFTSRKLNMTYHHFVDEFIGCVNEHVKGNMTHQFKRSYFDSNNDTQFWILFEFYKMTSTDEWDLVTLKHGWSHINESIFTYDSCGNSLHAATGLTYKCGKLTCNGYESLDTTIQSVLVMEHIRIQAFLEGVEIPALSVSCDEKTGDNNLVYIIVGLVVGFTIVSAAVVIVGSFLYKHYKYGPYNLLD